MTQSSAELSKLDQFLQSSNHIQTSGPLFEAVQSTVDPRPVFKDSKTFVDCYPRTHPKQILELYSNQKNDPTFSLESFIREHFVLPNVSERDFIGRPRSESQEVGNQIETTLPEDNLKNASDLEGLRSETHKRTINSMVEYITTLWDYLMREPDVEDSPFSSLYHLPNHYIVPGGRFREIYYWDSYFTVEGLAISNKWEMIESIAKNFRFMIDTIGHIPNGNRLYYLSRSQPPYFCSIIEVLVRSKGVESSFPFLDALEKEYLFWMRGKEDLVSKDANGNVVCPTENSAKNRVVALKSGEVLNRFWDDNPKPREESYREDCHLYDTATEEQKKNLFRNIRASCESGMDFTSRFCRDPHNLASLRTIEILPVDLNCLLYNMEDKLSEWFGARGDAVKSVMYRDLAEQRKAAIHKLFWDQDQGFFFDYSWTEECRTSPWSIASIYPLFFSIATSDQAARVAMNIKNRLLFNGGVVTTTVDAEHQWDKPNGWPPLQFLAVMGLENYGINDLARDIANRWIRVVMTQFKRTGKIKEKYNVCETDVDACGGEYPNQEGFGWTNGVTLAFLHKYNLL